ncbi:MAG: PadR family transcriptional regulator [Candidatus Eiseniibacteriota bacterium]
MALTRPLTELEGSVLGVVWARQPCTPYRVRREFTDSPSPYWSGSAGAIYPLMSRLESAGLLRSAAHSTGGRGSRRYQITPAGRSALGRWIGPPIPLEVAGVPPDPARMRIASMDVLPPARRRALLAELEAQMREQLGRAERIHRAGGAGGGLFDLMSLGALAMQRSRLEWIRSVAAELSRPRRGTKPRR